MSTCDRSDPISILRWYRECMFLVKRHEMVTRGLTHFLSSGDYFKVFLACLSGMHSMTPINLNRRYILKTLHICSYSSSPTKVFFLRIKISIGYIRNHLWCNSIFGNSSYWWSYFTSVPLCCWYNYFEVDRFAWRNIPYSAYWLYLRVEQASFIWQITTYHNSLLSVMLDYNNKI